MTIRGIILAIILLAGANVASGQSVALESADFVDDIVQFGPAEPDGIRFAAQGPDGDLYLTGFVDGAMTEDCEAIGQRDIWVGRFALDGEIVWIRQIGSDLSDNVTGLDIDGEGNIYVTGDTRGDLGGEHNDCSVGCDCQDGFLVKFDADGQELWSLQFGSGADEFVYALGLDAEGNCYLTGKASGPLPDRPAEDEGEAFLTKYSPEGSPLWTRQFGHSSREAIWHMAVDSAGNCYLGGTSAGQWTEQEVRGADDCVLAKFDADGEMLWALQYGTTRGDAICDMRLDEENDELTLYGVTHGQLVADHAGGGRDVFIIRCDTAGGWIWSDQIGTAEDDRIGNLNLAIDPEGNAYLGGYTPGRFDGPVYGGGGIYVAIYDVTGEQTHLLQLGNGSYVVPDIFTMLDDGRLLIAGHSKGQWAGLPLGPDVDEYDSFFLILDPHNVTDETYCDDETVAQDPAESDTEETPIE